MKARAGSEKRPVAAAGKLDAFEHSIEALVRAAERDPEAVEGFENFFRIGADNDGVGYGHCLAGNIPEERRNMLKKVLVFFVLMLIIQLYTTLVLTILWNWFVGRVFHLSDVSFWLMYGLVIFVNLFRDPGDQFFDSERRWKSMMTAIRACIPEDCKEFVREQLQGHDEEIWLEAGSLIVGRALGNTVALGIGLIAHRLVSA